jgi:FkbH-like protein
LEADETTLRRMIDEAVDRGEAATALALLGQLWETVPGPALAGYVLGRFERIAHGLNATPLRVVVLRSFTVEPLIPLLRAGAAIAGFDLQVRLGEFNAYAREILDPGVPLLDGASDIVILAVQTRDVAPDLWRDFADLSAVDVTVTVERVAAELQGWLRALRSRTGATLIVHDLELPPWPSQGILDGQVETSQAAAIRAVNTRLRETARSLPGVHVLAWDDLLSRHGRLSFHDPRRWLTVRMPLPADKLAVVAEEWLRHVIPASGRGAKCLVCDLDNTLWGGVVGEDGPEGIRLGVDYPGAAYVELQRAILDLHRRGIILAICSKNNPGDALPVLEEHPHMLLRPRHFSAMRINWDDKAAGLRSIAAELSIGTDSLVLLDDNPVECENVRRQLPEVRVLRLDGDPTSFAERLRRLPVFERLALSAEDRERGRLYASQRERAELQRSAGSLEDFHRSLQMRVEIAPLTPATMARAAQLTQKTNQFNMTTRRYTEQQMAAFASDPRSVVLTAGVKDRFGDQGIVGLVIVETSEVVWMLDTFLLSCRVIGRAVETAFLATIVQEARSAGAVHLRGSFMPTPKNAPAAGVYEAHGFRRRAEEHGTTEWELDLRQATVECPDWIERVLLPIA